MAGRTIYRACGGCQASKTMQFDPRDYAPALAEELDVEILPELGPGSPDDEARERLAALRVPQSFEPHRVADSQMAGCCLAGLWLLYDFLEAGHLICQEIETPSGSFWHAIMHRREPDYGNSKYWFRRVGNHPVYEPLAAAARELAGPEDHATAESLRELSSWDPMLFVDLCRTNSAGGPGGNLCRQVARAEWRLLFDYCYSEAVE
jgi:hypothetical protein